MPFTNIAQNTSDFLTRRAAAVRSTEPLEVHELTFRTSEIRLNDEPARIAVELLRLTKLARRWIYVFETSADSAERQELVTSFKRGHEARTSKFRYARLNDPAGTSSTLYVGSSESLRTRIRNHLGYAVGPSSLNMAHWPHMPDVEITLHAARYEDSLGKEALCDLEDWLAVSLSPTFGKRGSV